MITHQWLDSPSRTCQYQAYPGKGIKSQQHSSHTADQSWKRKREKESIDKEVGEGRKGREREREMIYSHISTVSLLLEETLRSIIHLSTTRDIRCSKTLDHHFTVATATPLCLSDLIYVWIKTVEPDRGWTS